MANKYIVHVAYRAAGLGVTAATATPVETEMPKHILTLQYEEMARRLSPKMTVDVEVIRV